MFLVVQCAYSMHERRRYNVQFFAKLQCHGSLPKLILLTSRSAFFFSAQYLVKLMIFWWCSMYVTSSWVCCLSNHETKSVDRVVKQVIKAAGRQC